MVSPDYMAFLCRITVVSLTIFKDPQPPRHEGIVAELIDTGDPNSKLILIFLERTASDKRPDQQHFSDHPNSGTVLESIVRTLKAMPSTLLASLTTSGSNNTSSLPIPLLDFTSSPSQRYQPIIDESESDQDDHKPTRNSSTRLLWFDTLTLAGTKVLHASAQLSDIRYRAEDRFVGSQNVAAYVPSLHNLWQIRLEPNVLSLFDLATLAHCVHDHDPLYIVLEHHCYWFVQIICTIVEMKYRCTVIHSKTYAPVTMDTVRIPSNDYLPDLAGRTMGILVCKVEEAVVKAKENMVLRERVTRLERMLRAHNLDPNVDVDSQQLS